MKEKQGHPIQWNLEVNSISKIESFKFVSTNRLYSLPCMYTYFIHNIIASLNDRFVINYSVYCCLDRCTVCVFPKHFGKLPGPRAFLTEKNNLYWNVFEIYNRLISQQRPKCNHFSFRITFVIFTSFLLLPSGTDAVSLDFSKVTQVSSKSSKHISIEWKELQFFHQCGIPGSASVLLAPSCHFEAVCLASGMSTGCLQTPTRLTDESVSPWPLVRL